MTRLCQKHNVAIKEASLQAMGPGSTNPQLNKLLDLTRRPVFTEAMTAERIARSARSTGTREALLSDAEVLMAERGMYAVSNRQISEAAGQGNNAAACYHFGTRVDLLRAIEAKHRAPIEELRAQLLVAVGDSAELRDWVGALGTPTWYARFAAQAMADPTYRHVVTKDALASPLLVQTLDGINRCLPELPKRVRAERMVMVRNLLMHTCAEHEGALARLHGAGRGGAGRGTGAHPNSPGRRRG